MNILGIRCDKEDKLLPEDNFVLSAGDGLLISSINAESLLQETKHIEQKKIVLTDYNP